MARHSRQIFSEPALTDRIRIRVRFSETDAMRVVWHGEYVKYFEDGREAFGVKYGGLNYSTITDEGYYMPIVKLELNYLMPLKLGDYAIVETRFINSNSAKIIFEYIIYRESDMAIVATGKSLQVFTYVENNEIELNNPEFFIEWKKALGIV